MKLFWSTLFIGCCIVISCGNDTHGEEASATSPWVDVDTPSDALPVNTLIGKGWKLAFSDEFNDNRVDFNKWVIKDESRGSRPNLGIKEWFFKPENVVEADGDLVLKVTKVGEDVMHCSSVYSNGKYYMKYGYAEARIKLADMNSAALTAFWLQSNSMSKVDGTGNDGAEIDVFESAYLADEVISTIHIDGYGADHQEKNFRYATPGVFHGYHVWGVLWNEKSVKIYYDGEFMAEFDEKWVPRVEEFLYLSTVATFSGQGDFKGKPADSWLSEARFDYVRVWTNDK